MSNLKLARFNPENCGFPKPRVPLLPAKLTFGQTARKTESAGKNSFRHFTRGRYALGEAYRLAGVGREAALLAPAYHCVTMLDPALALGADIQLYPLHADLSPDLEKLDGILAAYGKPVKALLAAHFFGVPQDFLQLKQWCATHHIILIEDCSHVLFTENYQAAGTGTFGRFVSSSPYKFFACEDGGLLCSSEDDRIDSVRTESSGLMNELRSVKHSIDKIRSTIPMTSEMSSLDERLQALSMTAFVRAKEQIIEYSEPSSSFSFIEQKSRALRSSRFIVSISSIEDNIRRRRSNYERWAKATVELPNCRQLFPDLPEQCIPYMFPLHIEHADPHFYWLKLMGLPIWRWDEMLISNCPTAHDYRLHLLHLPCHQSLTEDQMDWMIAVVQKTLRHAVQGQGAPQ